MKNKVIFALLAALVSLLLISNSVHALGIRPGIYEINYHPNEKRVIEFAINENNPNRKVIFSAEGELASYVTFDKTYIIGSGKVTATITFPGEMKTPGANKLYIAAIEAPLQSQFVGTAVGVRAVIKIYVPYPGKYIEPSLIIPDANIGQKVPVELKVINRGTEDLTVNSVINFYDSSMRQVDKFTFEPVQIGTEEYDYFRRYLNSDNLKPDNYLAEAIIDYSGLKQKMNATFRIGNLYINITDFTKNISAGEINPFIIKVKSNWNGNIQGVYADVKISNETFETSFRTPQIELMAWEEKEILGYFEAKGLKGGNYKIDITVNYVGHTTFDSGVLFVKGKAMSKIWIIVGVIAILIALIGIYLIVKRLKKPKRKKRR
jgi:hypothetical protein